MVARGRIPVDDPVAMTRARYGGRGYDSLRQARQNGQEGKARPSAHVFAGSSFPAVTGRFASAYPWTEYGRRPYSRWEILWAIPADEEVRVHLLRERVEGTHPINSQERSADNSGQRLACPCRSDRRRRQAIFMLSLAFVRQP